MSETELTVSAGNSLAVALENQGLGELLKPLVKEIHLFDTCVSGTSRLKDTSVLDTLESGTKLKLLREPGKFDDHAISLKTEAGEKIGYVPERDELIFARLMDAGKLLTATIQTIEKKNGFVQIMVGIYLVDF